MIVLIWFICVLLIIILLGEIRFHQLKTRKKNSGAFFNKEWADSIDCDIDILDVELSTPSIVPTATLAMRGSWRLAQDMFINEADFEELRACEYNKVLK